MWIRAQNKKNVVKVNAIAINGRLVYGYREGCDGGFRLGDYNSEAEALAVLDGIQEAITNMDDIFVMPELGFLK